MTKKFLTNKGKSMTVENSFTRKEALKYLGVEKVDSLEKQLPYKLPKCFPTWRQILESAALTITIAARNNDQDFALDYHAERWCRAIADKIPVYCISKNIIRDFEETEVPENEPFLPKDWVPRVSNFMIVFPSSVIKTATNEEILYAFVSSFVGDPKDSTMFKKGLCLSAMARSGIIFSTTFGIGDDGEILNREKLVPGSYPLSKEETQFLKGFRALVIQMLLCLEYAPQYIEEPAIPEVIKNQPRKNPEKIWWTPRMVGANYDRRIASTNNSQNSPSFGDRQSPRMHHRNAHWRSQACGVKYQDRIPRWIMPTIVNKN